MTMEELFDILEREYGCILNYGCAARIEFSTKDGRELELPAPMHGNNYTHEEIDFIISVWNEEVEGAIVFTFNGFPN